MNYKDAFGYYHPIINFLYFLGVFGFTVFFINPAVMFISFVCAVIYMGILIEDSYKFVFKFCVTLFLITALINPAFNHKGGTILWYFPSGNPLTAESVFYGAVSGLLVISVLIWFKCFEEVIKSDKFVYIFGRFAPTLAVTVSMALKFIPVLLKEFKDSYSSQKMLYLNLNKPFKKVRAAFSSFSAVLSVSLENSLSTAKNMKAKGYGIKKRTSFTIFKFTKKDFYALIILSFLIVYIFIGGVLGGFEFIFYPLIYYTLNAYNITLYIALFLLFVFPVLINILEIQRFNKINGKTKVNHLN